MAEYIDREAVMLEIDNMSPKPNLIVVRERLAKIPAADVAEVRHGEWKIGTVHPHNHEIASFVCTACRGLNRKDSNYCPNCGADMRGEKV